MLGDYPREKATVDYPREKAAWRTNRASSATWRNRVQTLLVLGVLFSVWYFGVPRDLFRRRWTTAASPYAYVTLLAQNPDHDNKTVPDCEDAYYIATRTLAYQLLHAPETRTNSSIPFIVLATHDVAQHKLQRLQQDGAIVKVVDSIHATWMKPGLARWRNMLDKIHIFGMTEYQKVLYLDADTLVTRRLDAIFADLTTSIQRTSPDLAVTDEGPLPETYMLAAQAAFEEKDHPYPPTAEHNAQGHLSGGFFVTSPSQMIFEYYMHLITLEKRFRDNGMEQDMLNYAHRRDGPMPWADITYTWTTTWPGVKEYMAGAATLHEKFWDEHNGVDLGVRKLWYMARGEMEGYWKGREESL